MANPPDPKEHLEIAKKQLQRVRAALPEPSEDDSEVAVTWAFYAYENAVVAAGAAAGLRWDWQNHRAKAEVATAISERGIVSMDVADMLSRLNRLRKDVQYGEPGPEVREMDLDELVVDLERFVDEVSSYVEGK